MKKLLFVSIFFFGGFVSSYAQLKVFGNGTVRLAPSTSALVNSLVQIGDTGMTAAEQETLEMGRRMQKMFGFVEQLIKEPSNKTKE